MDSLPEPGPHGFDPYICPCFYDFCRCREAVYDMIYLDLAILGEATAEGAD